MSFLRTLSLLTAPLLAAVSMPAFAQSQPIELIGDVKVVQTSTAADGTQIEELVDPVSTVPGDRLVFTTNFVNSGDEPVDDFLLVNPLPSAVRLGSDADPALSVSVDGGQNWGQLADLTIPNEDGTARPASHADVTHIRWSIDRVEPGQSGSLAYPAIIN